MILIHRHELQLYDAEIQNTNIDFTSIIAHLQELFEKGYLGIGNNKFLIYRSDKELNRKLKEIRLAIRDFRKLE